MPYVYLDDESIRELHETLARSRIALDEYYRNRAERKAHFQQEQARTYQEWQAHRETQPHVLAEVADPEGQVADASHVKSDVGQIMAAEAEQKTPNVVVDDKDLDPNRAASGKDEPEGDGVKANGKDMQC